MSTHTAGLLADLRRRGFRVGFDGQRVRVTPAEKVEEELRGALAEHEIELRRLILAELPPPLPFSPTNPDLHPYERWLASQSAIGDPDHYVWTDVVRRAVIRDQRDNGNLFGLAAALAELRRRGAGLDTRHETPSLTPGTMHRHEFFELAHRWLTPYEDDLVGILAKIVLPGTARPELDSEPAPPWEDPRPDLEADHRLWSRLLARAYDHDGSAPQGLFATLHDLRSQGACLTRAFTGLRIDNGAMDHGEYQRRRVHLMAHRATIVDLLRTIGAD